MLGAKVEISAKVRTKVVTKGDVRYRRFVVRVRVRARVRVRV